MKMMIKCSLKLGSFEKEKDKPRDQLQLGQIKQIFRQQI